jgi:hypothetical protein
MIMTEKPDKRRKGDGGTYLVIADNTPEFEVALNYAVHMARLRRGHVAMARIIEPNDFIVWQGVDSAAREESRVKAEAELEALAGTVKEKTGITPSLIIREGERHNEIVAIAKGNPALVAIVLGASPGKGGPGPLVAYFTAKGISQIAIPVIIVPGHLQDEDIKKLA